MCVGVATDRQAYPDCKSEFAGFVFSVSTSVCIWMLVTNDVVRIRILMQQKTLYRTLRGYCPDCAWNLQFLILIFTNSENVVL